LHANLRPHARRMACAHMPARSSQTTPTARTVKAATSHPIAGFLLRNSALKASNRHPAYPRSFVGVSHRSTAMVALTFPDGARRDYPDNITGLDIAKGISPSLAKRTVAMALDGALADLTDPIEKDAKIEFVSRE